MWTYKSVYSFFVWMTVLRIPTVVMAFSPTKTCTSRIMSHYHLSSLSSTGDGIQCYVSSNTKKEDSNLVNSSTDCTRITDRNPRRQLLKTLWESSFSIVVTSSLLGLPAWAEEGQINSKKQDNSNILMEDLSMPADDSNEEEEKRAKAALEERIRRKQELQKKASTPIVFKESLAVEQQKQQKMKRSKEEMRNALCEELGRGC